MSSRLLLALLLALPPALHAGEVLDLNGYIHELDHWSAVARELKRAPEQARELAGQVPPVWRVSIDGQQYEVPADWLRSALEAIGSKRAKDDVAAVEARLAAMRAEADALSAPVGVEAVAASARLSEILARPEFRGATAGPTWLERLSERLQRLLVQFLERLLSRVTRYPRATSALFWTLAIATVLLACAWLLRLLLLRPPALPPALAAAPGVPAAPWQQLLREALSAARREDYREATRLGYWAAIGRLEEAGAWPPDRTRTAREYLHLLPGEHPGRSALSAITSGFETTWYGGRPASHDQFHSLLTQLEELGCPMPSSAAIAAS